MMEIWFDFPELPPSVNHLYTTFRGKRSLSAAGRKFKNAFIKNHGGVDVVDFMAFRVDREAYYDLHIWCLLPYEALYNSTYGQRGKKAAKTPFKKVDAPNWTKLAADCVAELVDLDDCYDWSVHTHKRESPDGQRRLVALLRPLNLEEDPYELRR
jgi:hypothetical protein